MKIYRRHCHLAHTKRQFNAIGKKLPATEPFRHMYFDVLSASFQAPLQKTENYRPSLAIRNIYYKQKAA